MQLDRELRLLIVMLEPLTPLLRKGEIVPRYYNPDNMFDEVHFLLLNGDQPDLTALAILCGRARPVVHNLVPPRQMMLRTLGWRPAMLRGFVEKTVAMARTYGRSTHGSTVLSRLRSSTPLMFRSCYRCMPTWTKTSAINGCRRGALPAL